jgi:hypothetical protein
MLGISLPLWPYLEWDGWSTPSNVASRVLGREQIEEQPLASKAAGSGNSNKAWRTPDGRPMSFSPKERSVSSRFSGHVSAAREYLRELPEAFQYWIGGLALLGAWRQRRKWQPLDSFAVLFFAAHSLAAIHLAASLGYLSPRHLLPVVVLGLAPAAVGAVELGGWLTRAFSPEPTATADCKGVVQCPIPGPAAPATSPAVAVGTGLDELRSAGQVKLAGFSWAVCLVAAAACLACLPRTLAPVHASREGHRRAGEWLARAEVPGVVLDTRGWTGLYSGRVTHRYDAAKSTFRQPGLAYVVLEQRELEFDSSRSRTLTHLLSGAAQRVAEFAAPSGRRPDTVVVYRWYPERFTKKLRSGRT